MKAPWRWLADSSGPCSTGVRVGSGMRARSERHLRGIAAGGLACATCATCACGRARARSSVAFCCRAAGNRGWRPRIAG
jgi:hypothetical protein